MIKFIIYFAVISSITAIPCNFTFNEREEINKNSREMQKILSSRYRKSGSIEFECDDIDGDEYEFVQFVPFVGTRSALDDYEEEEVQCHSEKKNIVPTTLNNIQNKLVKVKNDRVTIQTLSIDKCVDESSDCSTGQAAAYGTKFACKQRYIQVTLLAIDDRNKEFLEKFYYPSTCECAMLRKKRRN